MSIGVSGVTSLNWTYLYDADGFLQFRVLIRLSRDHFPFRNQSKD